MSNAVPESKANELFNRLADVQFEDVEQVQAMLAELRLLNKQKPGNFITKVSLAEALLLCGHRDQAVEQMDGAFGLRNKGDYAVMDRLAVLYYFTANRERALRLVEEIAFQPGVFDDGESQNDTTFRPSNLPLIAAWASDFNLLNRFIERDRKAGVESAAKYELDLLTRLGTAEDVSAFQTTLIEAVRNVQVAVSFIISEDDDGSLIAVNDIIFDSSKRTRRQIENDIRAAVDYRFRGREDHTSHFLYTLTAAPTRSHGPFGIVEGGASASIA